ncbi:MAG: hypothetical protein Q9162_004532 [Coniocarpon cinnabarinum]
MADTVDLNTIAYDAPLSFRLPSPKWISAQTRKGLLSTYLTIPDADFTGKWVLITGANNGIGREAALRMASWGANIVLACRNPPPHETHPEDVVSECLIAARSRGIKESLFEWWEVDFARLSSVEALAKKWLDSGRVLDVLCNNAGMGSSPAGQNRNFYTKDGFEIIHQVNFLSHVLLTLHLLPSIARSSHARIVCTTSCLHYPGIYDLDNFNGEKIRTGLGGVQYYKDSKLYFQIWLTELQRRLSQHSQYRHIVVNGIHPGYANTGVWHLNDGAFSNLTGGTLVRFLVTLWGITSEQGSLAITYAASSAEAGSGGGRYFNRIFEEEAIPHTRDPDARLRVWRKVNDELKLEDKGLLQVVGLSYTA